MLKKIMSLILTVMFIFPVFQINAVAEGNQEEIPLWQKWFEFLPTLETFDLGNSKMPYNMFETTPMVDMWDWKVLLGEISGEEPRLDLNTALKIINENNTSKAIISAFNKAQIYPDYYGDGSYISSVQNRVISYCFNEDLWLTIRFTPFEKNTNMQIFEYAKYKFDGDNYIVEGEDLYKQDPRYDPETFSLDNYYLIPSLNHRTNNELSFILIGGIDSITLVYYDEMRYEETILYPKSDKFVIHGKLTENNKEISTADLIVLAKYVAGKINLTNDQKLAADLNNDSYINSDDLLILIKYLIGDITSLPVNNTL